MSPSAPCRHLLHGRLRLRRRVVVLRLHLRRLALLLRGRRTRRLPLRLLGGALSLCLRLRLGVNLLERGGEVGGWGAVMRTARPGGRE